MSERATTALVTGGIGVVVVLALHWTLRRTVAAYLGRLRERREPGEVASVRTRLSVLTRVVVAIAVVIVAWQVLAVFPATGRLGNALLASGAVLAAFVGISLSTPLGNLGAGILLAFTQPVRIGDRVTVGDLSGTVEEITLMHTVVSTDDDLSVFVPNSQLTSTPVVNRSLRDRRRWVRVSLPVALGASIADARRVVTEAARGSVLMEDTELAVTVGEVTDRIAWLTVIAYMPAGTRAGPVASELRERSLAALAAAGLLPQTA